MRTIVATPCALLGTQTAVAAGVPVHEYLVSVLRANEDDIATQPNRFTPLAWAADNLANAAPSATPTP